MFSIVSYLSGFAGIIVGNVCGIGFGLYVDKHRRHKAVLVGLNTAAALAIVYFSLLSMGTLPPVLSNGDAGQFGTVHTHSHTPPLSWPTHA